MSLRQDKLDAIDHLWDAVGDADLSEFVFSAPEVISMAKLEQYDDLGSWPEWGDGELAEMDNDEVQEELEGFRGEDWAKRAWKWLEEGTFPPLIVADLPEDVAIADGRGRTSVALGMGWKEVPVIWMKRR